ncbi:DENN MADD domain containing 2C, partial [Cichlidogyrus casuarinus]
DLLHSDGLTIHPAGWDPLESRVDVFPLTNLDGKRTYAIGYTFYRLFGLVLQDDLLAEVSDETCSDYSEGSNLVGVLVPGTILVLTEALCVRFLNEFFSYMLKDHTHHNCVLIESNVLRSLLSNAAALLTRLPLVALKQKLGIQAIQLELRDSLMERTFAVPNEWQSREQIIRNLDLGLVLHYLDLDKLVTLLLTLLTEGRVVLICPDRVQCSFMCEAILMLMKPFTWNFTYVSNLPATLVDILGAPGPLF